MDFESLPVWARAGDFARSGSRRRFLLRLGMVTAVVLSSAAFGQSANNAPQVVRFTVFSARPIADLGFVPRANIPAQKVVFQPTARSVRYEYRGVMPLRFVDTTSNDVVAEATIPPGMRDVLLLFSPVETPAAGSKLRFQVAVLDDGAARHNAGGLAIVNLSGLALSGTVGAEKVTLKPSLNPTLTVGRSAKVTLTTIFEKRTYHAYTATVNLAAKERALLILFPPFYKGGLEVQSRLLIDQPPVAQRP